MHATHAIKLAERDIWKNIHIAYYQPIIAWFYLYTELNNFKPMTFLSALPCASSALKAAALSLGILFSSTLNAQTSDVEQLALAREAIAKQDWRTAELLLVPLSQKQSQAQNPFVFYELAQVYENTRRPDAAKKIY
jgi:hypothetical protein